MKRFPWLKARKKTDPELPYEPPIWFGNHSNGEYFHFATERDRKVRKLILEKASDNARKIGMDRRDFLASAMGMATSLWVLNAVSGCGKDEKLISRCAAESDAGYCLPEDAMYDGSLACELVGGDQFIFDIQTHWFKKSDLDKFTPYRDGFGNLFDRTTEEYYVNKLFCESDTTMVALSSWPGIACKEGRDTCGLPLSNETNVASRDFINSLVNGTQRVVSHCQVMAQDPDGVAGQLEVMAQMKEHGIIAWKLYPGFRIPAPFTLTDATGRAVIEKGLELGIPLFCVHKGLPIGIVFDVDGGNHPRDVGVVAKDYPNAKFIIYHAAFSTGFSNTNDAPPEGPYDPKEENPVGSNALIRSLLDNGIGPNQNVYAEVGSALNQVLKDPIVGAHFFGKLMKYVGTENVCWGTDCVIYGSPQQFIEPFRRLEIPPAMQEQYGYPPLDAAQKAKIFGLNAAKPYGVDPAAQRCKLKQCPVQFQKEQTDAELGDRRWMFDEPNGPKTYEEFLELTKASEARGLPG